MKNARILGYVIRGRDNGSMFFKNAPNAALCPVCGKCMDYRYHPRSLRRSKTLDISSTYDNRIIYSETVLKYFARSLPEEWTKLQPRLHLVHSAPKEFYLDPLGARLEFDPTRRRTQFIKACGVCGGYDEIIGATPAYLRRAQALDRGIYHTDLEFGSGRSKFPLAIVDPTTKAEMEALGFSGLVFKPAFGADLH